MFIYYTYTATLLASMCLLVVFRVPLVAGAYNQFVIHARAFFARCRFVERRASTQSLPFKVCQIRPGSRTKKTTDKVSRAQKIETKWLPCTKKTSHSGPKRSNQCFPVCVFIGIENFSALISEWKSPFGFFFQNARNKRHTSQQWQRN